LEYSPSFKLNFYECGHPRLKLRNTLKQTIRQIMRQWIFSIFLGISVLANARELPEAPKARPEIGFAVIKTGKIAVPEGLLKPGGSFIKKIDTNFSAFLIKHHDQYLLFDTGLGSAIDTQYEQEMTLWQRPFFSYEKPVISAKDQLKKAHYPDIQEIILSHSHWDHAGGIADFPDAQIHIARQEMAAIRQPTSGAGGTWASQLASTTIRWNSIDFQATPYKGYASSLDLYKDGSVVLVPMPGHTAGSIGMFVTVDSGRCYFFIGDVAWTVDALEAGAAKFWAASIIVDQHADQTRESLEKVRKTMRDYPDLIVVPAHDSQVQNRLGYFPEWVR
jgi:glyoxylase-like metal-dependent hydrolase (beta-lactamase superfamily II)